MDEFICSMGHHLFSNKKEPNCPECNGPTLPTKTNEATSTKVIEFYHRGPSINIFANTKVLFKCRECGEEFKYYERVRDHRKEHQPKYYSEKD